MNKEKFAGLFPIGVHICREPMPDRKELKKDMRILKEQGFNFIKIQESWKFDEPEEGKYDFSACEELIAYAAELDMGVYLGLSMEHAPAWLWKKYPGARMVSRDGIPVLYEAQQTIPADGKPGPCFDDPQVMEVHLRFIRKLVSELGKYENIVVWNTWQEMGYESERLTGHKVCYCPNTIRRFQDWLKDCFQTLEALNHAWKSRYTSWEDVVPNRDTGRFCLCNNIAYEYFLNNVRIPAILKVRAEAIRQADPLRRPVFAHQGSSTVGSGIDWSYARSQDFLGCSCYPAWFHIHDWDDIRYEKDRQKWRHEALSNEMWESVALKFDYLRGCNPKGNPLWAAEFQGGPICTGLYKGRVPSKDDIRRWMLTAVSSGANAISFWVARAEIQGHEINGYSLLDSQGDFSERLEEAGRIGRALNRHPWLFAPGNTCRAQAAILVNEENYRLCSQLKGGAEEHLMYSTRGWHRLLWEQGVAVDFVEARELEETWVKNYRLLILPFPLSVSEKMAGFLTNFVKDGGHLISEACPGRFDPYGYGNRGELDPGMKALFGVKHESLTMVEEPEGGARFKMHELSYGDYRENTAMQGLNLLEGVSVLPNLYLETYTPQTAVPVLSNEMGICGTLNQAGLGTAWLIGTFIGHHGTAYRSESVSELVKKLLHACGVFPEHTGRLHMRRLQTETEQALFFTNQYDEPITERIKIPCGAKVENLYGEPLSEKDGYVELTVRPLDVEVVIIGMII